MRIDRLDHIVLTVASIEATCRFYGDVLGMTVVAFGEGRTALRFGEQKINLHEVGRTFEPKATAPTPGSADLCFVTRDPLDAAITRCRAHGVAIEAGPMPQVGTLGPMTSIYLRDPDGNLVEIASYAAD